MPKLKQSVKDDIHKALQVWIGPIRGGASPEHILHQCANHAIGLLEIDPEVSKDWYEEDSDDFPVRKIRKR